MRYKHFVGIDISKLTVDVFIYGTSFHQRFSNDPKGFESLLQWVNRHLQADPCLDVLFCFEHSGFYSLLLAVFLEERGCLFSMITPLQVKRSLGIVRGKSDKIDAQRLAEYAYEKREKITLTQLPSSTILKLHPLMTLRDRLSRQKGAFVGTLKEQSKFLPAEHIALMQQSYANVISALNNEIKSLESTIKKILKEDAALFKTFQLITGIKGIGFLTAVYLIIYTHNFARFENWRKCACFAGIAPFANVSGTSLKSKNQVHPIANRQMKKMLHIAAMSASHTDKEMKAFFQRKVEAGKNKMLVLNIIRNKLLARAFAVAKRGTEYIDLMRYAV